MGTNAHNLQFLGVPEETVRAALPRTLVGQWSERFVTACPDAAFEFLDREASRLSKKLACTVLSVSIFDGDALSLALFQAGKRLTRHSVDPESGRCEAGDPKRFCTALGLPPELAPKLKRLFAACSMQEDKLDILQALLGTPLYLRHGDEDIVPSKPLQANPGPLERWVREHPEPPKIKNQCKAGLIQEVPDRALDSRFFGQDLILRPLERADEESAPIFGCRAGDVTGTYMSGGDLARCLPDGSLELTPLEEPEISDGLIRYLFDREDVFFGDFSYAFLDGRLVIAATFRWGYDSSWNESRSFQTVLLRDSAGILPCYLPLVLEGEPVAVDQLHLLPDGGFLAVTPTYTDGSFPLARWGMSTLSGWGPDGAVRWTFPGVSHVLGLVGERIYVVTCDDTGRKDSLLALDWNGTVKGWCAIPFSPYDVKIHILHNTPYILEGLEYQKDALLHRLTPGLEGDGEVLVPYMSDLALSPDGTLLYAAGYQSGLRVIDTASLQVLRNLPQKDDFYAPITDGQNRLWVGNGSYFECYTPELECISRHRLKGDVCKVYPTADGRVCAVTFQQSKYITRVYRFS